MPPDSLLHRPASVDELPSWYSGERYDEDGDTMWLPVFHKDWIFEGKSVSTMREVVGDRTRGKARADAASEWGVAFTDLRARKVWMERRSPTFNEEIEYGWTGDMVWECPKDTEGALPYWRIDYVRQVAGRD